VAVLWTLERSGVAMVGTGMRTLLDKPMTAFFASRRCPGPAIRAGLNWALEQAHERNVVVSGFHSPLEQSVLKLLLQAGSPAVATLARPIDGAKLPTAWRAAIDAGSLTLLGPVAASGRLTQELAFRRNNAAAVLAEVIVIAYADAEGNLAKQVEQWRRENRVVRPLA
jgi:hypothetical protein